MRNKKPGPWEVFALDTKFRVFHLGYEDIPNTIIKSIDTADAHSSKFKLFFLIKKAARFGNPRPDDQEKYQIEYIKQLISEESSTSS